MAPRIVATSDGAVVTGLPADVCESVVDALFDYYDRGGIDEIRVVHAGEAHGHPLFIVSAHPPQNAERVMRRVTERAGIDVGPLYCETCRVRGGVCAMHARDVEERVVIAAPVDVCDACEPPRQEGPRWVQTFGAVAEFRAFVLAWMRAPREAEKVHAEKGDPPCARRSALVFFAYATTLEELQARVTEVQRTE